MSRFEPALFERALRALGKPAAPVDDGKDAVTLAAELARHFEGFYSKPYLCPAAVPTIGYGATHYLDGRRVTLSDPPISREAAEQLLRAQLTRIYLPAVLRQCPVVRTAPAGHVAALVDFTFNLGEGKLRSSTLRRVVNEQRWDLVPAELRKWVYGGGVRLNGLVRRREAEIALITSR